mgnify:CR=1 FL=1
MLQIILSVFITLVRCHLKPLGCTILIFLHAFSKQIEFSESILGILVSMHSRSSQPVDRSNYILGNILALEQQLAQLILCELMFPARCAFQ